MEKIIKVIVADDHGCVRLGVNRLLGNVPYMKVVGEASDTPALARLIDICPCDVVVSDIGMPGMDGESNAISFLGRTLQHEPQRPVIILTMIHHSQMLARMLQLGVSAIVDKRDAVTSLLDAINASVAGVPYYSPHVQSILDSPDSAVQAGSGVLSAREWQVFQMYVYGMTNGEIAEKLGRSGKTISTQKRSAMRKMGLDTDAELIEYARLIGLI
ncbi:response regulator transcription factor [Paraburkholderia bonniea]|uniref:response regulator transcription factor n=1 Tax=Paraburkholderia bonniea TaxID=2152891 RepID=UPI001290967B|nr:response regulator transcription factor [Paraburkholderia bonniea]WJF90675.1 response regulator transcription factor [Paraburkholderia bonniea]WJF93989.1 response regulator transcription factor [Paraburkholderia bonniea]